MNNKFFKPTPSYKEYVILDLLDKNKKITQRYISEYLNISVSMVNSYLGEYAEKKLVRKKVQNSKDVQYSITKKGKERIKYLNISFLKSSQEIYNMARENIAIFTSNINKEGYRDIYLYGAGEVAEILLGTILLNHRKDINILGVIDDDVNKQGNSLLGIQIYSQEILSETHFDGVLISSFTNQRDIEKKIQELVKDDSKIIKFFE